MRLSYILNAISLIFVYFGIIMLSPIAVALIYGETGEFIPFILPSIILIISGKLLKYFTRTAFKLENINDIKKNEALMIVMISWITFGVIAAIPYLFYGFTPINALFEGVSGVTTTGASIFQKFDYPKALLFWRAMSQWIGGMGIIVLFIAVLPQFSVAGRQMFYAEIPGPTEDKLTPRIRQTATALWGIYILLTTVQIILLIIVGMNPFDAVCNSFTTLSSGGLSPNPNSIGGYNSIIINWIFIFFMFLSGINFALLYRVWSKKNLLLFFKNEEFKLYLFITLFISAILFISLLLSSNSDWFKSLTQSIFQVISMTTSTGFSCDNYTNWNIDSKIILFIAFFTSACAGSTAGGIKTVRLLIIFKYLKRELLRILHPNAFINIKVDNITVPREVMSQTLAFIMFYILIFIISAIAVAIIENNVIVGFSGSISCLGAVGPGMGSVGPSGSFNDLTTLSKSILILNMLIGRLELIPFLMLLHKDTWTFKWV